MEDALTSSGRARKAPSASRSRRAAASASGSAAAPDQEVGSRDRHRGGSSAALAEHKSNVAVGGENRKAGHQRAQQRAEAVSNSTDPRSGHKDSRGNKRKRHASQEASPNREDVKAKTNKNWSTDEKAVKNNVDAVKSQDSKQRSHAARTNAASKSPSVLVPRPNEAEEQPSQEKLRAQLLQLTAERDELQAHLDNSESKVAQQKKVLAHIHSQCSCTICFELAWRPHVLSPCGHIFCACCLLMWFKRPLPNEAEIPAYITGEDRVAEERRRTLGRQKVCPHCREEVTSTPAEVWMVKGLIESIDGIVRSENDDEQPESQDEQKESRGENLASGNDLWKGIYQDRLDVIRPLYDEMDDVFRCMACHSEVVDGLCSNPYCQRVYEEDDVYFRNHDDGEDDDDDDDAEELFHLLRGEDLPEEDDGEWDTEDDSFIDDGPIAVEIDSGDEEEEEFQQRRRARRLARNVAESDGDDDEVMEVDEEGRPLRRPLRRRRIVASLSDSDESDIVVRGERLQSPRMGQFSDEDDDDSDRSSQETLSEEEDSDLASEDDQALFDGEGEDLEEEDDDDYHD